MLILSFYVLYDQTPDKTHDDCYERRDRTMALFLKGAEIARALTAKTQKETENLKTQQAITPCLAMIRVGSRVDDLAYERSVLRQCEKTGIRVQQFLLPETCSRDALLDTVTQVNSDCAIHGCLLLRPLPDKASEVAACELLLPEKDMDGVSSGSLAAVFTGSGHGYPPCTAEACMTILKHYRVPLEGRHAVVIGRSLVVGRPLSMLLIAENATVTICHSHTRDLPTICRDGDIVIAAAGQSGLITAEHVRSGQTVLDVGIHTDRAGHLCGDVAFHEVAPIVDAITPVPGGIGMITSAILSSHVVQAAQKFEKVL